MTVAMKKIQNRPWCIVVYEHALVIRIKRLFKHKQHPIIFRAVGHAQNWNPTGSDRVHTRRVEHQEHDLLHLSHLGDEERMLILQVRIVPRSVL
jgi:hypothetical protein